MDRLRYSYGNEPGVQLWNSFKRDHRNTKPLRVTNVMAHRPGIKLVNGLAEASTNGDTIYTYRCRAPFLIPARPRSGPIPVPHCYYAGPASWRYSWGGDASEASEGVAHTPSRTRRHSFAGPPARVRCICLDIPSMLAQTIVKTWNTL